MRRSLMAALIGLVVCLAAPARAGFKEGWSAYQRGDNATAYGELAPLAEQGHAKAQNYLGLMFDSGYGVPRDASRAVEWFRKAAEQGHANARNYLGLIHAGGRGVPRDGTEAVKWFRKAAGQGHVAAMFNLGILYYKGKVVPRDYVQAHAWFDLAARGGVGLGETFRAKAARLLTPSQIEEARRLTREWKPKGD